MRRMQKTCSINLLIKMMLAVNVADMMPMPLVHLFIGPIQPPNCKLTVVATCGIISLSRVYHGLGR